MYDTKFGVAMGRIVENGRFAGFSSCDLCLCFYDNLVSVFVFGPFVLYETNHEHMASFWQLHINTRDAKRVVNYFSLLFIPRTDHESDEDDDAGADAASAELLEKMFGSEETCVDFLCCASL